MSGTSRGTSATELPRGVTGPVGAELMRLAAPAFVSFLLRIAYQWVDALWVRGLGVEATAAWALRRTWLSGLAKELDGA